MGASVLVMLLLLIGFVSHCSTEVIEDTNRVGKAWTGDYDAPAVCPQDLQACDEFCRKISHGTDIGICHGEGFKVCKCRNAGCPFHPQRCRAICSQRSSAHSSCTGRRKKICECSDD